MLWAFWELYGVGVWHQIHSSQPVRLSLTKLVMPRHLLVVLGLQVGYHGSQGVSSPVEHRRGQPQIRPQLQPHRPALSARRYQQQQHLQCLHTRGLTGSRQRLAVQLELLVPRLQQHLQ